MIQSFLHRLVHPFLQQKNISLFVTLATFLSAFGAFMSAFFPLIFSVLFGGDQNAGFLIAGFTAIQIFVMTPLIHTLSQKTSLLNVYFISIFAECVGAFLWFMLDSPWAILIYATTVYFRWTGFITDTYLLQNVPAEEGGFWFSFRDEMVLSSIQVCMDFDWPQV